LGKEYFAQRPIAELSFVNGFGTLDRIFLKTFFFGITGTRTCIPGWVGNFIDIFLFEQLTFTGKLPLFLLNKIDNARCFDSRSIGEQGYGQAC
jgi:hypothetical protein